MIDTAAGVTEPTRTATAADETPVVSVEDVFVVTVTFAEPAATPVTGKRYRPVVASYEPLAVP